MSKLENKYITISYEGDKNIHFSKNTKNLNMSASDDLSYGIAITAIEAIKTKHNVSLSYDETEYFIDKLNEYLNEIEKNIEKYTYTKDG